jgi:2-keto-3-deoxy-6-phosphogluconate aldolase
MAWRDWIRTVEIVPVFRPGDSSAVSGQADALLRTGCKIFHVALGEDLAALGTVRLLAPLARRYEGLVGVSVDGPARPDLFPTLAEAGANSVTLELESLADPGAAIEAAHSHGLQAGISFSSGTDPADAVARGAGADLFRSPGESFYEQLKTLRLLVREVAPGLPLAVGGGITHENVRELYDAGARVLLVRTAIFEREDLPRAYRRLVQALA